MILSGSSISLQAVLSSAITTSQPECHVDYLDYQKDGLPTTPTTYRSALNSTTDVSILPAPTFNPTREVLNASIYNKDTVSVTVTVKTDDGTTERIIAKATLLTLETFCYEKGQGWYALDANGNRKEVTGSLFSSLTVTGDETIGGNVVFSSGNKYVLTNTTDGSDSYQIGMIGGGLGSPSRGGGVYVSGNEYGSGIATGGEVTIQSGTVTGSGVYIYQSGTQVAKFLNAATTITGSLTSTGPIKTGGYTVGTLPANSAGLVAYVTDQLTAAAAKGVAPTGGGAVTCYVMNTGAGWVGI